MYMEVKANLDYVMDMLGQGCSCGNNEDEIEDREWSDDGKAVNDREGRVRNSTTKEKSAPEHGSST